MSRRPGPPGHRLAWTALVVPALLGLAASVSGPGDGGHVDGPPPGHTGGFGEPTCARCHFGAPEGPPPGELVLEGLPAAYGAERRYRVTVRLVHPEMGRAGFELAIRFAGEPAAGRQAGTLVAPDGRAEVVTGEGGGTGGDPRVSYARHTEEGASLTATDTARWTLEWTAPAPGSAPVVVHVAANAANDDDSEFGDRIYVDTLRMAAP